MGLGLTARYDRAVATLLANAAPGMRFGLERTRALLDAIGRPHERLAIFHVAGTNGKGSSLATIEAVLRARGLRVGRYSSPHLVDWRERVTLDGRMIDRARVVAFAERWGDAVARLGATRFEVETALALHTFADAGVDAALLETGLGGRLDSTNVVTPVCAGVVSVGLDHTELLGDTLEAIAGEKGGIYKPGVPAVAGAVPPAVRAVLAAAARAAGASAFHALVERAQVTDVHVTSRGTGFTLALGRERAALTTGLIGEHQAWNAAFALLMLHAAGAPWRTSLLDAATALPTVRLPGRHQRVGPWLFDVAHNLDGARALVAALRAEAPDARAAMVIAVLRDKDWRDMLAALAPAAKRFVLTAAPSAPPERAWDPQEALAVARTLGVEACVAPSFDAALRAVEREPLAVVTGSFHTVGDAMARLQVAPVPG